MVQQIRMLRAALPSGARTGGNMGFAQIDVPGLPPTMAASSRIDQPTLAQQNLGFVGAVPETFESTTVSSASGQLIDRSTDSEAKILNNIAARLGDNTSASGSINLMTERPPCASCSNVIQQFQERYPNIKINVIDNNGIVLKPPRNGG
jgi:filamentous hemagglutinin